MDTALLKSQLWEKAAKEQSDYIENLKTMPPQKIIDSSYEKVIRDDILMLLEENFLSEKQIMELLKLENPLSACYSEWMDTNYTYTDKIRDAISEYTKRLVDENKEQKQKETKRSEPER